MPFPTHPDIGGDARYGQTPPQLFPVAMTGVDGGHYGYVIHAPVLALSDYPIAQFEDGQAWRLSCGRLHVRGG